MASILIYVLRRDLRLGDNPIFHDIAKSFQQSHRPYTHVLPVYIVPAQQIEVSGFLASGETSPFPEARSSVAKLWRCGPNRAKFLAESVWSLKKSLEDAGSGLVIRPGMVGQVVKSLLDEYAKPESKDEVYQVWMTGEEGSEEKDEEREARSAAVEHGKEFKLWTDEKYFVHEYGGQSKYIKRLLTRHSPATMYPCKTSKSYRMFSPATGTKLSHYDRRLGALCHAQIDCRRCRIMFPVIRDSSHLQANKILSIA